MTDDLLDEATRYGERFKNVPVGVMVLALVERVQLAEAVRDDLALLVSEHRDALGRKHAYQQSVEAERDEARGKLDKVRAWAHHIRTTRQRGDIEYNAACDVLAILDGKTGD